MPDNSTWFDLIGPEVPPLLTPQSTPTDLSCYPTQSTLVYVPPTVASTQQPTLPPQPQPISPSQPLDFSTEVRIKNFDSLQFLLMCQVVAPLAEIPEVMFDMTRLQEVEGLFSQQKATSTFLEFSSDQVDSALGKPGGTRMSGISGGAGVSLRELGEELDNLRAALVVKQKEEEEELKKQMQKTWADLNQRQEKEREIQNAKLVGVEKKLKELEGKIVEKPTTSFSREGSQQSVTNLLYSATMGDLAALQRLHCQVIHHYTELYTTARARPPCFV